MSQYVEVREPILNTPFENPTRFWYIREGEMPQLVEGRRRPAVVFPPRDQKTPWSLDERLLRPSKDYPSGYELMLVNLVRERVEAWQKQGHPGVARTTIELIQWWTRDGREKRLFFAQLEAALSVIFLKEARADFLQGIIVPRDEPSDDRKDEGYRGFERYACKMATGAGKTTVMGMLAAWSILNKVNNRSDARFSDVVLVVCPNVTIRERLGELDPERGEASIYRTRDLVPPHLISLMTQGKVLVTNWHVFEPQSMQTGGISGKVIKAGVPVKVKETITIGTKTTTARGNRYFTRQTFDSLVAKGDLTVIPDSEETDEGGNLRKVQVESTRYVESDTALVNRVLGREVGGKKNILVMNDEAHHAYRIRKEEPDADEEDEFGEQEEADEFFQEATVWIDGLDRIQKLRGVNYCIDLSATPYFLGRVGQETNKPFPWVVSDFGLIEAIEAGLVKIPQLAIRDTTGAEYPSYFNIWQWILETKLTPAERGGKKGSPKPEAILKYAHHPIAMLGGLWEKELEERGKNPNDTRPPVYILVVKNTKIAKVIYDWLAEDKLPTGIPPARIEGFRNREGKINTIRVDSKVVHETNVEGAKGDESRWMRFTLDTVGKTSWPADSQGRPIYPEGFEEVAKKLERPFHPPGRDVRCIVSVGMLTEGWDCNTVTHIIGLRPFMSQLLCEQVVGRGLRRTDYQDFDDKGRLREEVAKVLGVPFEVIPFKANPKGPVGPRPKRYHVHAIPEKAAYEIKFPRVEGYTQAIRNRVAVNWAAVPTLVLKPDSIPPEVEVKGYSLTYDGRLSLGGPGRSEDISLREYRENQRVQQIIFELAKGLTKQYLTQPGCEAPAHVLFPQMVRIIQRYFREKVEVRPPADIKDLGLSPYYGWLVEVLTENIRPDAAGGETPEVPRYETSRGPGSTAEVDFWTSREPREVVQSHLNYVVPDTAKWEQTAAYFIDKHPMVDAFVKNAGLGFAIPYLYNGQMHDYVPDFIIRLKTDPHIHLILETKGYDEREEVKTAAARRWVDAVNAECTYGLWRYAIVKKTTEVAEQIAMVARDVGSSEAAQKTVV
jgi:type III restriction enzyme